MSARNGPEYLAATRARLLAIVEAAGASGTTLRLASEAMRMSMCGCTGHMRALMDAGHVVTLGFGNRIRYFTAAAAEERQAADRAEFDRNCREVVIEGRTHLLASHAVRSVFELGASLG